MVSDVTIYEFRVTVCLKTAVGIEQLLLKGLHKIVNGHIKMGRWKVHTVG